MHFAAKGNNPFAITYFRDKGIDIDSRDNE
jgi:hypothetical protein